MFIKVIFFTVFTSLLMSCSGSDIQDITPNNLENLIAIHSVSFEYLIDEADLYGNSTLFLRVQGEDAFQDLININRPEFFFGPQSDSKGVTGESPITSYIVEICMGDRTTRGNIK